MNALFADSALCGPSNDLKTLTSRLDRDAGARQDYARYNAAAGPSRQLPFRALPSSSPLVVQPAEAHAPTQASRSRAFDVSALQRALQPSSSTRPVEQARSPQVAAGRPAPPSQASGWTSEYRAVPVPHQQQLGQHHLHDSWRAVRSPPASAQAQPHSQPAWSTQVQPAQPAQHWRPGGYAPIVPQYQQQPTPLAHASPIDSRPAYHIATQQPWPTEETLTRASTPSWPSVSYPPEVASSSHPNVQPRDSALADTARAILSNDAVQEDRETDPAGAREFLRLMERLAAGETIDGDVDVQDNLAHRDGPAAGVVQDPYMPGIAQPQFAADGSLVRAHSPLRGMAPLPSWLASTAPHSSDWTSAFEEAEAQYAGRLSGKGKQREGLAPTAAHDQPSYAVPADIKEALASSAATSSNIPGATSAWEEQLDFDEDLFADYYGRDRWRPSETLADPQTEAAERWRAMTGLAVPGTPREGHEQVEALQRAQHGVTESEGRRGMQENEDLLDYLERAKTWREDEGSGYMRGKSADAGRLYMFQKDNPYLAGQQTGFRDMTGEGALLADEQEYKNVLESEAAVLANPKDARAWFELGLKQQENERDDQAIRALLQSISLDPTDREAYLALAVSYCNDGELKQAHNVLETWIDLVEGRPSPAQSAALEDGLWQGGNEKMSRNQRHDSLTGDLMRMARQRMDDRGEVDADVQIALGVLFNASEEYDKAQDCFRTALDVRPDDWMLYNRMGAVLANGGRSAEALEYYHGALQLHPGYVRAMFNIGISSIKLARYHDAGRYILDAIRLQHATASEGYPNAHGTALKGVTSDVLWQSLRTACMHLNRHDLLEHCQEKNLAAFANEFTQG